MQKDSNGRYPRPERLCHPVSILNEHSGYLMGLHALPALTIACACPCLVETFRTYEVPQDMHGSDLGVVSRLTVGSLTESSAPCVLPETVPQGGTDAGLK